MSESLQIPTNLVFLDDEFNYHPTIVKAKIVKNYNLDLTRVL